jgi:hypothetical protein
VATGNFDPSPLEENGVERSFKPMGNLDLIGLVLAAGDCVKKEPFLKRRERI